MLYRDVKSREFLLPENDNQDTQMTSLGFPTIKTIERCSAAAKVKYRAFWYKSIKIGMIVGQWVYFKFKLGTHQYLYGNGRHFGFQNGRHI
jgi:hypothetical protein